MPNINAHDMDEFFAEFSKKFNADKLAGEFNTPEERAALRDLTSKLDAAVKANEDTAQIWQTVTQAQSVVVKVLKLLI